MNNTKAITFRQALNILEDEFDAIYRGISTVKEMTTDLMSAISFEGENPETIYHRFETKVGPNRIVKEDQVIALALPYVWMMITSKAQMLRVMKDCEGADTLTREEKFQVFVNVCDNMLAEGRMTKATHKRFTEIW